MPPLIVNADGRWIDVDLQGNLGDWARRAADQALARWGIPGGGRRERRLTRLLEGAGEIARKAVDASMVFLLYPVLDDGIRAVARFCPVDLAGREGEQAWSELLAMLLEPVPGVSSPEVTEIISRAGQCRRIRWQGLLNEGSEGPVGEHLAYVWAFPQYGSGVIMATAFTNLEEAGRWRSALDELAAAAELDESS